MRFSIVTISFNQRKFIERAIQSVLSQNFADIEYIVVDPGSTDGSRDIIEKYRDKISHIVFKSDTGPADGLNNGFAYATGSIFGFLNSDDILYPGSLSAAVACFANNPAADVVSGGGYIIDENDLIIRKVFSDRYSLIRDAYGQSILIQPSTFFRASAFRDVNGFNRGNKTNWDGELFYNMAQKGKKFVKNNGYWSGYRLYPESITGSVRFDEAIRGYGRRKFIEIMGREKRWYDKSLSVYYKVEKHMGNSRSLYERLLKGGIYGRG